MREKVKTVWGMPLWHIGRNAKGFVAVGLNARGVIATGAISLGIIFLGAIAIGDLILDCIVDAHIPELSSICKEIV